MTSNDKRQFLDWLGNVVGESIGIDGMEEEDVVAWLRQAAAAIDHMGWRAALNTDFGRNPPDVKHEAIVDELAREETEAIRSVVIQRVEDLLGVTLVALSREEWDVVIHSLEEDMDQLTPASVIEDEWVGEPPNEEAVEALANVHEKIMQQVVDNG